MLFKNAYKLIIIRNFTNNRYLYMYIWYIQGVRKRWVENSWSDWWRPK